MTLQSAAENAASADRLAQAALETAERALQEARTAQEGSASRVIVRNNPEGVVIAIPREDGTMRRIVLSQDNSQIVALEGVSAAPVAPRKKDIPDGMVTIFGVVAVMVTATSILGPFAKAWGRRIERRAESAPSDVTQRLAAIEQAVETVAVEVERISEGQRFTAKLLAERMNARADERVLVDTERR